MDRYLKEITAKNKILSYTSLGMFLLSVLFFIGIQYDSRLIVGINPWIKPLKFSLSILVYALTMIYLLQYHEEKQRKNLSLKIAGTMWFEMILIAIQSLRGVPSHFNNSSPIDSVIFATMGIAIMYNTFVMGKVTYGFYKSPPAEYSANVLRAIRWGLVLFLLGCFEGAFMSSGKGHTVGGADGGPGLPFLNWSTSLGDLRIAHFVGLHGIQLMLGVCLISHLFIGRIKGPDSQRRIAILLNSAFVAVLILTLWSFILALTARSPF